MRAPLRGFYEGLLETQWQAAGDLQRLQRRYLVGLLHHARATTPFYRFRLNALFRPNGEIDWDAWSSVPIVTRADLSTNHSSLTSRAPIRAHGPFQSLVTSGSTGDPVRIRTTGWMTDTVAACNWRAQAWHGVDWSRKLLNSAVIEVAGRKAGDLTGPWGPPWDRQAAKGEAILLTKGLPYDQQMDLMRQHRPTYAATGVRQISELVDRNDALAQPCHLDMVLTRGSAVSAELRQAARRSFGAELLELYSSKEAGPIAHPCPDVPGHLHVNDETVLVEIVDEQGRPAPRGQLGRVIVTPFTSTALPLIRYDQGDLAIAGGPCSCGRGLSTLQKIVGRTWDLFRHPDGRALPAMIPLGELRPLIGARLWQVAQVGPTRYEVRLPGGIAYNEDGFAEFTARARDLLFGDAEVIIVRDHQIARDTYGKFKEVVNEWNPGRNL